ncbi:MAG: pyrroline-5-carboxylate reductase [Pseudomonadota bacterium]
MNEPHLNPSHRPICFVGGGNMAAAIVQGLVATGYPADLIQVVEPALAQRDHLNTAIPGLVVHDSAATIDCDVEAIVLAVKPQITQLVCGQIAARYKTSGAAIPTIISVAAGIRTTDIGRWLDHSGGIIRVMPNQGAMVGLGSAGMFATAETSDAGKTIAAALMGAVGDAIWVDSEAAIDSVTAVSGSGPAYFFLLMETMQSTAESLGLSPDVARKLVVGTATGAAKLASENADLAGLRRAVTSPGGTTAAAINHMLAQKLDVIVGDAMRNAKARAAELADEAATGDTPE